MTDCRGAQSRFAIYYTPDAAEPLSAFGSAWLGRDMAANTPIPRPVLPGCSPERLIDVTRVPWLYGFHATLKPPFALANGMTETRLAQTVRAFTASRRSFSLPPLQLSELSGFLALTTTEGCHDVHALADDCVRVFDPYRMPADAEELARRRRCGLTPRQEELLVRWGYPFVMDEWRFHMTLSSRLEAGERELLRARLASLIEPALRAPLVVDSICLFQQDQPLAPFRLVSRHRFGGA